MNYSIIFTEISFQKLQIFKTMKLGDKSHHQAVVSKDTYEMKNYKLLCNKVTKMISVAKQRFFHSELRKTQGEQLSYVESAQVSNG